MEERPNYYSIIPATVRYDKDLKPNEKLLYGEITSLCNKNGYCYATNEYFAKLYDVHKNTISTWISNLQRKDYINSKIIYKEGSREIEKRLLFLGMGTLKEIVQMYCQDHIYPINEITNTYQSKDLDPINEITKENNTSINNINNNNDNIQKSLFKVVEENFGRTLSPFELEEIMTWEDTELTRYAIKKAVLNSKFNISYISKILYQYEKNNIKTIQQAQVSDEEYQKKKSVNPTRTYYKTQRQREEEAMRQFREVEDD